jgi:DNA repair exonuclease SbcCD ATPase subunit
VEALRARFAKKIQGMQERARRAEARVDREKSQYDQQKLQTGISLGATVLGALFGRGGFGRATTAARGAGRVARELEDVQRAEAELRDTKEAIRALEIEVEEEARAYLAEREDEIAELDELVVRPRKSDIAVTGLKLGWKPD